MTASEQKDTVRDTGAERHLKTLWYTLADRLRDSSWGTKADMHTVDGTESGSLRPGCWPGEGASHSRIPRSAGAVNGAGVCY